MSTERDLLPHYAVCEWTLDAWINGDSWDTSCAEKHLFSADGPKENGYKYCPYCGRPLVVEGGAQ